MGRICPMIAHRELFVCLSGISEDFPVSGNDRQNTAVHDVFIACFVHIAYKTLRLYRVFVPAKAPYDLKSAILCLLLNAHFFSLPRQESSVFRESVKASLGS